jgi:hypothetical protein
MNDYTGRLLHDAHYNDLLKEARGGWLLKEARQPGESRQNGPANRRLVLRLVSAVMAALLAGLLITANVEPRIAASTTVGGPYAMSQGQGVAH